jgi:hypothetical protein
MDEGESWWLIKLVFWGILIFIVLKLGLALLLMKTASSRNRVGNF